MFLWIFIVAVVVGLSVWTYVASYNDKGINTFGVFLLSSFGMVFAAWCFSGIFFDQLSYQKYELKPITSPVSASVVNDVYSYQFRTGNDLSTTLLTQSVVTGTDTTQPPTLTVATTCANSLWAWGGCSDKHTYHISTGPAGVVDASR